ncbi:MAG: M60 family metallopeptidase [Verrucomicrobiales bacterium]|nr:M60 family metallopeptidase [Verrucomicrobiales bacterium]
MKKTIPLLALILSPLLHADDETRKLITAGGGTVDFGKSVPGRIDLTNDFSFPILQDSNGAVVAAAGKPGKGRVVGYTHGGFLKPGTLLDQAPVRKVVLNSIRWAGRSASPKVGVHPGIAELVSILEEAGLDAEAYSPEDMRDHKPTAYCLIGHEKLSDGEIVRLFEYANDGGGVVIATTPWAFKKKYDPFSTFPGNQIFSSAGFQFLGDGYAKKEGFTIGSSNAMPRPDSAAPGMTQTEPESGSGGSAAVAARKLIEKHMSLSPSERSTLITDLKSAKDLSGSELEKFLNLLLQLNKTVGPIIPTKETPVTPGQDPLVDAIIDLETHFNENTPAGTMYAIPASADYPGAVGDESERVSHSFTMDGVYKGWLEGRNAGGWAAKEMRPTGIYAPPGEVVKVTLPARLAGEGFEVVIGSYNGHLRNRDNWHRYPDWQVKVPVTSRETHASSGLGGLVTIRIPRDADYAEIPVTIEGGIRAPLYEHGKTGLKEWNETIRKYPAPWAELASNRMIVSIPSDYIRKVSDPDKVMEIWNGFIDTAAVLTQVDRDDYRAERIVFDRQTSAGSMHSSYPVAAHLGASAEQAVDSKTLKDGNWGFFHEYGHNNQHNLWALPGTGETTCNLWSVYIYEEYVGKNRDETHSAIRPLNRKQRLNAYFSNGARFQDEWSVWVALETYLMIQEEFGWEPFQKVFDEYNRLEPENRPKGQNQINDQWVIRLSKACGMNLQPFWATWNLPMSNDVERALKGLPVWEDHPVKRWATAH